jgi:hypothetical protein
MSSAIHLPIEYFNLGKNAWSELDVVQFEDLCEPVRSWSLPSLSFFDLFPKIL